MTTLLRPRQRAEDFAARVDGPAAPLRAVRSGSGAVERETDRLMGVVTTLRREAESHGAAVPRTAFATGLRELLMAEAAVALTPQRTALTLPPRTRSRTERRLVAAASAAVLLGGTAGMAAAAQNALPGEALYPVKRGIEKVEAGLATSSGAQGRDLLTQASGRLDEVRGLLADPATAGAPQVSGTLAAFTAQAREGADLMMASYRDGKDAATIRTLRAFAAHDLGSLEALSSTAPPQADQGL